VKEKLHLDIFAELLFKSLIKIIVSFLFLVYMNFNIDNLEELLTKSYNFIIFIWLLITMILYVYLREKEIINKLYFIFAITIIDYSYSITAYIFGVWFYVYFYSANSSESIFSTLYQLILFLMMSLVISEFMLIKYNKFLQKL